MRKALAWFVSLNAAGVAVLVRAHASMAAILSICGFVSSLTAAVYCLPRLWSALQWVSRFAINLDLLARHIPDVIKSAENTPRIVELETAVKEIRQVLHLPAA